MNLHTIFFIILSCTVAIGLVMFFLTGMGAAMVTVILGFLFAFSLTSHLQADRILSEVMESSPAASFGITNFEQCKHPSLFSSRTDAECKQLVIDLATKQQGEKFAKQAIDAISLLESKQAGISIFPTAAGSLK